MRNARFESIEPNYRRKVLEVVLREGRRRSRFDLPFGVLGGGGISARNRFVRLVVEDQLDRLGVSYVLEDGTTGAFPSDFVLYICDPSYQWSPVNQLKRALRSKVHAARLSIRVIADALRTSPSQVVRLLEENRSSKQLLQLFQLAELAGCRIQFSLRKKPAA